MNRRLQFAQAALDSLTRLEEDPQCAGLLRQVRKVLGLLEANLRHPSLNTHKFRSLHGPNGEEIFEAYVQNQTPGAYRVFFFYGPDRVEGGRRIPVLTIVAITQYSTQATER